MSPSADPFSPSGVASKFVQARQSFEALREFPGPFPTSLDDAYQTQDSAIAKWDDAISGWKVGRINGDLIKAYGTDRLIGPIFQQLVKPANNSGVPMGVFRDGFAAVEGEFVVELAVDAPADKTEWTTEEARAIVKNVRAGIEIASSPLPSVNDDGPLVTISDFGNNYGLIVGDVIAGLLDRPLSEWTVTTHIDGEHIGSSNAGGIPGGPIESLRYALGNAASRGHPLKAGMYVSTGAVTGVHQVKVGQSSVIEFVGGEKLVCRFDDVAAETLAAE